MGELGTWGNMGHRGDKGILETWRGHGETWNMGGYGTGAQGDIGVMGETRGYWGHGKDMGKHGTWGDMGQEHKGTLGTWGDKGILGPWGDNWDMGRCRVRSLSCHQEVSLSLHPGEFVAVLAPPGGGKSSLVAAALGLRPLAGGAVLLDGIPLTPHSDPALRQQVTHMGHPREATATPRSPSIPCCCPPSPNLSNVFPWPPWATCCPQRVPTATPGSAPGPQQVPTASPRSPLCPEWAPTASPRSSLGASVPPPGSPIPPLCHLGPQFHPCCHQWTMCYHGYSQVTHCPNIHDHHVTPRLHQHIPTATPRLLLCSQQFFTAILISSASLTMTLPPPHVSTHPLLVPARSLCCPMFPHVPTGGWCPTVPIHLVSLPQRQHHAGLGTQGWDTGDGSGPAGGGAHLGPTAATRL